MRFLLILVSLLGLLPASPLRAAGKGATLAVLPLVVYSEKDVAYLEQGIRAMLVSRLVANAGITPKEVNIGSAGLAQIQDLKKAGREAGVDYLVGGSLTALGGGASLDIYVTDTATPAKAEHFYATADKESEIIASVDRLAQEISRAVFHVPAAESGPSPTAATEEGQGGTKGYDPTVHPEKALYSGRAGSGLIRPTAGFRQFARSQTLHYFVRSMAVGDLDGDNADDVVIGRDNMVKCYHMVENRLQQFAAYSIPTLYQVVKITLGDLDGDGRDEIYLAASGKGKPYSTAFVLQGGDLRPLFRTSTYYIRAVRAPGRGWVLAGQRPGAHAPLDQTIFQLEVNGDQLLEGEALDLPRNTNIFNFVWADVDGDAVAETVVLDDKNFLNVFRPGGVHVWRSSAIFGGSPVTVGREHDAADSDWDAHNALYPDEFKKVEAMPQMQVVDLDGDKVDDVVVVRNEPRYSQMLANVKSYDSAEIYGLAWNGVGLDVLWRTRRVDGFITDAGIRPVADDGQKIRLYAGLILPTGMMDVFSKAKSTVLTYDVELGSGEAEEKK